MRNIRSKFWRRSLKKSSHQKIFSNFYTKMHRKTRNSQMFSCAFLNFFSVECLQVLAFNCCVLSYPKMFFYLFQRSMKDLNFHCFYKIFFEILLFACNILLILLHRKLCLTLVCRSSKFRSAWSEKIF